MDSAPHSCRREHHRATVEIPVVLIATAYGTTNIASARSMDLSEGGMGVTTTAPLREQQSISVEFKATDESTLLKLYGQIRHAGPNRYGIQFITPSEQQRKEIRNLLMN